MGVLIVVNFGQKKKSCISSEKLVRIRQSVIPFRDVMKLCPKAKRKLQESLQKTSSNRNALIAQALNNQEYKQNTRRVNEEWEDRKKRIQESLNKINKLTQALRDKCKLED